MQPLLYWIVAALVVSALTALATGWLIARRAAAAAPALPVEWDLQPRPVFTADERRMYRQLRDALPHHIVLAKLPLVRFCQPADPQRVRYWYDLLGAIHVSFAVCSANGRVLASIDLSYDRGGLPSRATRIKQSVLGACRVRYLRCAPDHMPSIPELQLLVPQSAAAARGPQPAMPTTPVPSAGPKPAVSRRRERTTLWQDSMAFSDSFFSPERSFESTNHDELRPLGNGAGPASPAPPH